MATPTLFDDQDYAVAQWAGETGTGGAVNMARWSHKTVQRLAGTGTVTVEGSMDGVNWEPLKALGASPAIAISLPTATNAMAAILENTIFIRVVVAAGTATVVILGNVS